MRTFRAISPVVATTLLIIIAVVTAIVLYLWVSGTVSNQPTQQTKLQEAIKIEAVKVDYDPTAKINTNITEVYVRNVGSATVTISTVYAIDANTGKVLDVADDLNVQLAPGEAKNVLTVDTTSIRLTCDNVTTVLVKVVTKDGIEATYLVVAR